MKPVIMDEEDAIAAEVDWRGVIHETAVETLNRALAWREKSDSQMRLQMGELTAREIRSIRAVVNNILSEQSAPRKSRMPMDDY